MHTKTLIFDNSIMMTGSVNMTHNGHEYNKEQLFRICDPTCVADVVADFEKTWATARPVEQRHIDAMLERATVDAETRRRARSKSRAKEVIRSLSADFNNLSLKDDK